MQGANDSNCFKKKRNKKRSGGGSNVLSTAPLTTGRGGGTRGNAWRREGSGRRHATSRFKSDAISPLLLPHVKVTLRNIGDVAKHQTIENIITSVRKFLVGAFPSSHLDGTVESDAYAVTLVLERDEFDAAKSTCVEAMSVNSASGDGSMGTAAASAFSYGWIHELSSDRASLPFHTNDIVTNFMASIADSNVTDSCNINWVVDTAMSQMMQQCGKQYLNFVGGRVILDEISSGDLILAERVKREREELASGTKVRTSKCIEKIGLCGPADEQTSNTADEFFVNMEESNSVGTLNNCLPAVCVRILSVTPVKKSKRRGEIGGEVQLALHPPDPCLLFKEVCRDAGKKALEKVISMKCCAIPGGEEHGTDAEIFDFSTMSSANKVHPQVPYYPLLSPSERSRAVTRSLVLVNRIIQTMKFHAASLKRDEFRSFWEVTESSSQKTWKEHNISGKALRGAHPVIGVTPDRDLRYDLFDSTIENSNDYKAYVELLNNGVTGNKSWVSMAASASNTVAPPAVDSEGRPLSAIVVYMRAKHAKIDKVKSETLDACEKARKAAVAAKEKTPKNKVKSKREPLRKLKKEAVQTRKQASAMPLSRPVCSGGSGVAKS